ncbi:Membrane-associated phospholipid phosphatase [Halanaeroarchaeum sp. HSR-CO]|uniref:phosphatase PAP2 family protein n=1 Tax=Halanaeroarchaeum sp. HSR-CO TaxID=2866382 RepID=UPI00217E55C3|nr:phosphatase PAP2 family protein [Halanaeroarchaeum sp. HSR-CO]UWG48922.1 Membrane-associated phospholipid phosphatase [Halanaeroarchaeum sp. HSR-CO]
MRGQGVAAAISQSVPETVVPILVVVTGLGDPVFVAVLAVAVYWLGPQYGLLDRRAGATVLATTFFALALTLFLKYGFAMPRPPADVMLIPEDGMGFPSGHATGATATYAALAVYLKRWSRTNRYGLAGVLVVVVALSRVFLGVHYFVDVVAGIVVGLLALAAVRWVASEQLTIAFAMSVPVALAGTLLAGTAETALQVGVVSGGAIGWWLVNDRVADSEIETVRIVAAAVGGGLLLGVGFESGVPIVAGFAGAGAGALFLAVPGLNG